MNKLTDFQRRMIVLGVGLLIILFGTIQAIFKFDIFIKHKRIVDDSIFILMMLAAVVLFGKRRPQPEPEAKKTEETNYGQTEESK